MVKKVRVIYVEGGIPKEDLGEQLKLMLRYYEPLSTFHFSGGQRAEMGGIKLSFSRG